MSTLSQYRLSSTPILSPLEMLGSLHCSPDPLAVLKGPVSKGMKEKGEKIGREGGKNGGRDP